MLVVVVVKVNVAGGWGGGGGDGLDEGGWMLVVEVMDCWCR